MEDEKIMELYFRRSEDAIPQTALKYGSRCRSVAYSILSDPEDSEECVNDTYLAAWNAMPPTRPLHLGAFLAGITRKLSVSRLRRRCADRRGGGEYALSLSELDECVSCGGSLSEAVEMKELAGEIAVFLSSLSIDDRRIFMCRYWLVASIAQIAESTGFSESKIKSSLRRSRLRLKAHLEKEGLL